MHGHHKQVDHDKHLKLLAITRLQEQLVVLEAKQGNIGGYIREIDQRNETKISGIKLLQEKLRKLEQLSQNQAALVEGLRQENQKVSNCYFRLMQRACGRLSVLLEALKENFDVTVDSKVEQVIEAYSPERKATT